MAAISRGERMKRFAAFILSLSRYTATPCDIHLPARYFLDTTRHLRSRVTMTPSPNIIIFSMPSHNAAFLFRAVGGVDDLLACLYHLHERALRLNARLAALLPPTPALYLPLSSCRLDATMLPNA